MALLDIETIRELVRLMSENDLAEVRLRNGTEQISLKRRQERHGAAPADLVQSHSLTSSPGAPVETDAASPPVDMPKAAHVETKEAFVAITSPMVGTYYSAPNPDAPPFVEVGSSVNPSTVVCIVEAMKVFNEIRAETSGRIVEVLVSNGDPVEYGQPLFRVRPKA